MKKKTRYVIRVDDKTTEEEDKNPASSWYFSPSGAFLSDRHRWITIPEFIDERPTALEIFNKIYQEAMAEPHAYWLSMFSPKSVFELVAAHPYVEEILAYFTIAGLDQRFAGFQDLSHGDFPVDYLQPDWGNESAHRLDWTIWVEPGLKYVWHTLAPDIRLAIARQAQSAIARSSNPQQ